MIDTSAPMHLIVAIDRHGAIGKNGDLLYHISADLRRFKALTMGNAIVMGRRTFESLPKGALPGRQNIVVTRQDGYQAPGADVAHSLAEAIRIARAPIYIIGGAEIYRQALAQSDILHLTVVDAENPEADTFFPAIALDDFAVEAIVRPDTTPACSFVTLRRVKNFKVEK